MKTRLFIIAALLVGIAGFTTGFVPQTYASTSAARSETSPCGSLIVVEKPSSNAHVTAVQPRVNRAMLKGQVASIDTNCFNYLIETGIVEYGEVGDSRLRQMMDLNNDGRISSIDVMLANRS